MAFEEGLGIERLGRLLHQHRALLDLALLVRVEEPGNGVGAEGDRVRMPLGAVGRAPGVGHEAFAAQVHHPLEPPARASGPIEWRGIELQLDRDLVQQFEWIERLAVHLVDEGDDGNVAQPADFEQFQRLRFDALGRVQHHHRRIGSRQYAVGVLGEVLVARRVQEVEHQPRVIERHGARRNRDAALALDLHPVRTGAPLLAARPHRPGRPDAPRRPAGSRSRWSCQRPGAR